MGEEINISSLLTATAKGIKSNFVLLIVLAFTGGGLGYTINSLRVSMYESSALYRSSLLKKDQLEKIVSQLNESLKYGSLQERHPSLNGCKSIVVESTEMQPDENKLSELIDPKVTFFKLKVTTTHPDELTNLDTVIAAIFRSNNALKKYYDTRKSVLEDLVLRLEKVTEQNAVTAEDLPAVSIHKMIERQPSTYQELALAKLSLKDLSIVEGIEPFYIPRTPMNSNLVFILSGSAIAILLGFVIRAIVKA